MAIDSKYGAIAHPRRRQILSTLRTYDRLSAGEIAEIIGIPKPTLSGHLKVLRSADLVVAEKKGATIWYRLNLSVIEDLIRQMLALVDKNPWPGKRAHPIAYPPPADPRENRRRSNADFRF